MMTVANHRSINITIEALICCLFALFPQDDLFKNLNVQLPIKEEDSSLLYKLVNKRSLRGFSSTLVNPIIYNKNYANDSNAAFLKRVILLKKYIRKYKFLYYRYFFYNAINFSSLPTEKEINTQALKTLIILSGV